MSALRDISRAAAVLLAAGGLLSVSSALTPAFAQRGFASVPRISSFNSGLRMSNPSISNLNHVNWKTQQALGGPDTRRSVKNPCDKDQVAGCSNNLHPEALGGPDTKGVTTGLGGPDTKTLGGPDTKQGRARRNAYHRSQ